MRTVYFVMAISELDQQVLGRIAREAGVTHPPLSKGLYRVLGLSVILTHEILALQGLTELAITTPSSSEPLQHHILWLAREGLSITEDCIIPFCKGDLQSPRCRVMAAKLRATFYHLFCLLHNDPEVPTLVNRQPGQPSDPLLQALLGIRRDANTAGEKQTSESRQTGLRDPIPSLTSESSYITNPWAHNEPAPTSSALASDPVNCRPRNMVPLFPPGFNIADILPEEMPASIEFILPSMDFVPDTKLFLTQAKALAEHSLPGCDPLRLSITYESCLFTLQCLKEPYSAKLAAMDAIQAVYQAEDIMSDGAFMDTAALVTALGDLAKRTDSLKEESPITPVKASELMSAWKSRSPRSLAVAGSPLRPRKQRSYKLDIAHLEQPNGRLRAEAVATLRSGYVDSPTDKSQASFGSGQSVKEKKRRRAERAEQSLEKQRAMQAQPGLVGSMT